MGRDNQHAVATVCDVCNRRAPRRRAKMKGSLMKRMASVFLSVLGLVLAANTPAARSPGAGDKVGLAGDYLEVRSCEVFTGTCVANSELNLTGREGVLVWSIREGAWNGVPLQGLAVIAVVSTDDTLGDLKHNPRRGRAVLILDAKADSAQQAALKEFVKTRAGQLVEDVAAVKVSSIDVSLGQCSSGACAKVTAGELVEISTRCMGSKDHLCGNEDNYYPPLTDVKGAFAAVAELAAYRGHDLNVTWQITSKRSAYLATFSL